MTKNKGFTLLEMLVAMMIMITIVLMMSAVFKQMTTSWGVGMRKVRVTMRGRAALDHMAQEMAHAVADPTLKCNINSSPSSSIGFYTFDSSSTNRAVSYVEYERVGNYIKRTLTPLQWDNQGLYPLQDVSVTHDLLGEVDDLSFTTADGASHSTNLPDWVGIRIVVSQDDIVSRVALSSSGADRKFSTDDDISSEE